MLATHFLSGQNRITGNGTGACHSSGRACIVLGTTVVAASTVTEAFREVCSSNVVVVTCGQW